MYLKITYHIAHKSKNKLWNFQTWSFLGTNNYYVNLILGIEYSSVSRYIEYQWNIHHWKLLKYKILIQCDREKKNPAILLQLKHMISVCDFSTSLPYLTFISLLSEKRLLYLQKWVVKQLNNYIIYTYSVTAVYIVSDVINFDTSTIMWLWDKYGNKSWNFWIFSVFQYKNTLVCQVDRDMLPIVKNVWWLSLVLICFNVLLW